MQKITIYMTHHHVNSARSLCKILEEDWPIVKAIHENGSEVKEYEGEHSKGCTDCKAELFDIVLSDN